MQIVNQNEKRDRDIAGKTDGDSELAAEVMESTLSSATKN